MAKKNKTKGRRNGITIPIAVVAGFLPGIQRSLVGLTVGGFTGLSIEMSKVYLGYDPPSATWHPSLMWYGFYPIVIGLVVHKIATIIGINRMLARARIPFVRV